MRSALREDRRTVQAGGDRPFDLPFFRALRLGNENLSLLNCLAAFSGRPRSAGQRPAGGAVCRMSLGVTLATGSVRHNRSKLGPAGPGGSASLVDIPRHLRRAGLRRAARGMRSAVERRAARSTGPAGARPGPKPGAPRDDPRRLSDEGGCCFLPAPGGPRAPVQHIS